MQYGKYEKNKSRKRHDEYFWRVFRESFDVFCLLIGRILRLKWQRSCFRAIPYEAGSRYFGKTKRGEYLSEKVAIQKGYRPANGTGE